MMLRCILPVGQGAFYLERFKSNGDIINVVYDCGSLTDVKIVEKEIKSNFIKGEEIEIVFISHIDKDHVNGLEYLLKYCKVKNIVFPYTKKKDKIALNIEYFCNNNIPSYNDFTYKFINDPYRALRDLNSDTILYGIREYHSDNDSNWTNGDENEEKFEVINSGINLSKFFLYGKNTPKINWEYVPFNFREDKRKKQFFDELKKNIGLPFEESDIDELLRMWNNIKIRNAIIDAYKKVKGNMNTNSMVLFSGIRDKYIFQRPIRRSNNYRSYYDYCCFCYCKKCFDYVSKKNGCLYTGDYEANGAYKWHDLKNAFSEYWDYIGCVQIPHHGSYRNYNHEFALLDAYFIISAGCKNRFRHPSGLVIKDLYLNEKYPFIVTEQHDSEIILKINV